MTPDDDIYDLDVDLDTAEDDDADALMREAVAAVEARRDEGSDLEVEIVDPDDADDAASGSVASVSDAKPQKRAKSHAPLPFSGMRTPDEVRVLEEEVIALRERCLRALADLENYRRRTERERTEMERFAGFDLIREFLGVVDNLERALGSTGSVEDLSKGVEMIHRQLLDGLKRFGVERVESIGSTFDPAIHEAVARVEDVGVKEPTVVNEMQSGFLMHDRLLRPAIVQVAMPVKVEVVDSLESRDEQDEEVSNGAADRHDADGDETVGTEADPGQDDGDVEAEAAAGSPEELDQSGDDTDSSSASASSPTAQERDEAEASAARDPQKVTSESEKKNESAEAVSSVRNNQGPVVIDYLGTEIGGED
jgi:molecular chaperone GrpE